MKAFQVFVKIAVNLVYTYIEAEKKKCPVPVFIIIIIIIIIVIIIIFLFKKYFVLKVLILLKWYQKVRMNKTS